MEGVVHLQHFTVFGSMGNVKEKYANTCPLCALILGGLQVRTRDVLGPVKTSWKKHPLMI